MFSGKKSSTIVKQPSKVKQGTSYTPPKLTQTKDIGQNLPQLVDVPKSSLEDLLTRKLQLCSIVYNFQEPTFIKEKQIKFATLKEMALFASQENGVISLTENSYHQIVKMVSDNIFRTFPPKEQKEYDPEYDEQDQEPSWPHLKLIYDFFLHFINSPEANTQLLRKSIGRPFISQLLEIFNTEDIRERKSLKNILLSIYLKFFEQREFIRKQIRNIFLKYIYEEEQFNGVAELLEILSMAINGFNVPLRQEHKDFYIKVLVPLHKPRYVIFYHRFLIECLKGFIRKDEDMAEDAILGILKFWPKTNTEKQILYLQEIGELSDVITDSQFLKIQEPLMKLVTKSISSLHFQVAETALNLWDNPDFLRHVNNNLETLLPIIFTDLFRVSKVHWNSGISELANAVLRSIYDANPSLFNQFVASNKFKLKKKR